jgi:deazaflavin-dependent oxidoreductase (nitroreductase family)
MSEKPHGMLRRFNRAIVNPITKLFAGKFFYALVYHQGRKSGKAYSTPVVAVKREDHIYCPLPYGEDTDWFLNIKAAEQCQIKINGKLYFANVPEIVSENVALPHFSPGIAKALKKAKIKNYLRLLLLDELS